MSVSKVYTCSCGMRTTEPFLINGVLLCTLCAESEKPSLVNRRAVANWREFTNRKVSLRPHFKDWEPTNDD